MAELSRGGVLDSQTVNQVGPQAGTTLPVGGGILGWWNKNKSWLYPLALAILSALGGGTVATSNLSDVLPDVYHVVDTNKRVDNLDARVKAIEGIFGGLHKDTNPTQSGNTGVIQVQ